MSLSTASISLADGLKTAATLWEEARAGWDDPVSEAFEANYWMPLKTQVEATLTALDRLGPILARAQQDCS
ncbi:MAG TPA: hypothetical protein VMG10_27205 [Gemmataceae bacterium]|nr:hypothetical protein [Gemmataceae bacterium]